MLVYQLKNRSPRSQGVPCIPPDSEVVWDTAWVGEFQPTPTTNKRWPSKIGWKLLNTTKLKHASDREILCLTNPHNLHCGTNIWIKHMLRSGVNRAPTATRLDQNLTLLSAFSNSPGWLWLMVSSTCAWQALGSQWWPMRIRRCTYDLVPNWQVKSRTYMGGTFRSSMQTCWTLRNYHELSLPSWCPKKLGTLKEYNQAVGAHCTDNGWCTITWD